MKLFECMWAPMDDLIREKWEKYSVKRSLSMKLTPELIALFEQDQQDHGTEVALFNLVYLIATGMLHDLGVQTVKTEPKA